MHPLHKLSWLAILVMTGCSQPCPEPVQIATKHWTRDEEYSAAMAVSALPADSILIPMMEDYWRLRKEAQ